MTASQHVWQFYLHTWDAWDAIPQPYSDHAALLLDIEMKPPSATTGFSGIGG